MRADHHAGLQARRRAAGLCAGGLHRHRRRAGAMAARQSRSDRRGVRRSSRWRRTVPDNGGVYLVPAFSGLYAPHWRADARGLVAGLTRFANKGHIARAALEATAYQTREVLDAMAATPASAIKELRVDGGMVVNDLLMQFQADMLDAPVVRPKGDRDDGARRRLCGGARHGFLGVHRRHRRQLGGGPALAPRHGAGTSVKSFTKCGTRRWPGPSTGSSDTISEGSVRKSYSARAEIRPSPEGFPRDFVFADREAILRKPYERGAAAPSPRERGEGWGEGESQNRTR